MSVRDPLLDEVRALHARLEHLHGVVAVRLDSPVNRVARKHMLRTAGEVRFIKDRGGDTNEWGWGTPGPSQREMDPDFLFDPKYLKPLAQSLRAALMALGHAMSAYTVFSKIKSATISPDGNLGGRGYIQKIPDMRRQLMNTVEALSSFTDTVYDELQAKHWTEDSADDPRERGDVKDILQDVDEIKADPEGFAEEEEAELDNEGAANE